MSSSLASRIREFLHELFGSRVAECREDELMRTRNDYETRLHELAVVIAEYRDRIAQLESKLDRWEMVIIPLASPAAGLLKPRRDQPTFDPILEPDQNSWAAIKARHEREETNDGIREEKQQVPAEPVR